ncbi:hypothetical protein LXT21_40780 [Myxococcus sp. K38C18041901]|uniref:hypothetical protein n=1 Tax=Myxococcus guangdongensis TaxID=2906760 RepID=UPI0020A7BA37|nr:hypothetical protein [Myxococcus guangdongensis]MCP3065127.1 hypothetical protein [Myxococcus guangdongensis]
MNGKWFAVTLVLVLGAGFLAGRQAASTTDAAVMSELERVRARLDALADSHLAPTRVDCPSVMAPSVDTTRLGVELAQVLREELARSLAAPRPVSAPALAEPLPQSSGAHQQARHLLDDAVRARRWTTEDALAFRRALVDMTPTQRDEVIRRLVTSINSQALDIQTQGPPF